ncbi:carnitine O-acetyltransferase-like [Epinephelus lanceolatus]|uniref:carnitine O-acetyltransferase-like n=1 Tax=Epinephelus lanceolatus TaxID=310571 RepID=UPI0014469D6D|nr:carnitine O-acetyltransferase-like [Epinephelus lanceolatus]
MLRICSRALIKVGMARPFHLVKPVSATLVPGRNLSQQKGLPSQPVPPLQQTCDHYLSYLEPMLGEDELKQTKKLVEEFRKAGGVGERLQRSLEMKARNTENWFTEDFVKGEFLGARKPLAGFSNPGGLFPKADYRDKKGQIRFAAKFIAGGMELKTMIDNETLPDEYMRGKPLCMKQFEQLFSSCRIPDLKMDTFEQYTDKHITVVHNGQFFVMEAYNSDGSPLTIDQLCVQLERICNSSLQTDMEPVGILTTQQRDSWSKTYNSLIKDETNKESVLAIQSSIFTVCLDGAMPSVSDDKYRDRAFRQMLHGGGSQWNSGNRWFDKGLQLIIGEHGTYGANFSCAAADGVVHMSVSAHLVAGVKKPEVQMRSPMEPLPVPQKLHFNLTPEIKKDIEEAKQHMDTLAQNVDLSFTEFDHFGKNFIKAHKIRPNAFIQMALKLAYYRMYQRICPSLEYVSLRAFKLGRISMMNSNSPASAAFVKAFDDSKIQNQEKADLLEKAIKEHAWYTDMAFRGQDIYCHLYGLQKQALKEKIPMPDIFTDTSYDKFFDCKLGSSYISKKSGCLPCFGPEVPEQYDVLYTFTDNQIEFTVATFKSPSTCEEKNASQLAQAVENALLDLKILLENTSTS